MQRRVELDETLPPVRVPARILHEICQHALESVPEECCGLIVGNELERYRHPVRCRNEMTALHHMDPDRYPRDGRAAYYMNDHDVARVRKEAEEAGEYVTAVYHSHIGAGAYLSALDLAHAEHAFFPFPDADQIVVPVFERTFRDIAVFQRGEVGFAGHPVEHLEP